VTAPVAWLQEEEFNRMRACAVDNAVCYQLLPATWDFLLFRETSWYDVAAGSF